jgi:ribose transport system ATP-binding protein
MIHADHDCALEMAHISKRFNQSWVLKDVNLKVRHGGIHAIVGHNGAGKSTLMKIALGAEKPTEGEVRIGGRGLTYSRPAEARTLGVGMVMQERSLITTMSGIDNIFLNSERLNVLGCVNLRRERAEIEGTIAQLGIKPSTLSLRVSDMSTIEQKLIEIAKALRLGSKVLVLDEPTVALGRDEIDRLFEVLRGIANQGTGIVLITHRLAEVFVVSDEVTCLRDGKVVTSRATNEVNMADLLSAVVGPSPVARTSPQRRAQGLPPRVGMPDRNPTLIVKNLRVGSKLRDVSFNAFSGEVLGIVGLAGSGRTALLRTLFGDLRPNRGELCLFGKSYRPKSPYDAIGHGVFMIPQDRAVHGLVLSKSIAENIILVALSRLLSGLGFLKFGYGCELAVQMMRTLEIRASGVHQLVGELSGGNQQKVVFAKALTVGSPVLLLDEPISGVDIASARQIVTRVRGLAENGSTVLWVSSDLLEITNVCDRIVILDDGIVSATVARDDNDKFNERFLSATIQRRRFN